MLPILIVTLDHQEKICESMLEKGDIFRSPYHSESLIKIEGDLVTELKCKEVGNEIVPCVKFSSTWVRSRPCETGNSWRTPFFVCLLKHIDPSAMDASCVLADRSGTITAQGCPTHNLKISICIFSLYKQLL